MRVVKVSGKYLSCILNVISENHQKVQPSTFQCSAQVTFHTNLQSSHFYLFKAFANCFHILIWKRGSNTSFGLIKGKCIIYRLPISSLSLFGQLSLVQCSWQALLSHRHKKHGKFMHPLCCPITLLPNELISNFNVFNNIKITVHYSVHMRISGEKVRISDEAERVQSISYSHIRSLSGF